MRIARFYSGMFSIVCMSEIFISTFWVVGGVRAKNSIVIDIMAILNITDDVAYLLAIFLVTFFVPPCNAHIPNINVSENVSKTKLNPKKNPENVVTRINDAIVCDGRAMIQFVMQFKNFDCGGNVVDLFEVDFIMYPGAHSAEKPKGILNKIFHAGMLNVRARRYLTYMFANNNPMMYR